MKLGTDADKASYQTAGLFTVMAAFNEVLSRTYLGRCGASKLNPPPEDWDGVYKVETKGEGMGAWCVGELQCHKSKEPPSCD